MIESFLQQDVEGLVLLSPVVSRDDLARAVASAPTVVVGRTDIRVPHCDVIINDNELGGELVVQHCWNAGTSGSRTSTRSPVPVPANGGPAISPRWSDTGSSRRSPAASSPRRAATARRGTAGAARAPDGDLRL